MSLIFSASFIIRGFPDCYFALGQLALETQIERISLNDIYVLKQVLENQQIRTIWMFLGNTLFTSLVTFTRFTLEVWTGFVHSFDIPSSSLSN